MFFPKKMVGIDIGTSSIKVVELSHWGEGQTLENYGEIKSTSIYREALPGDQKGVNLIEGNFVSAAIRAILEEAKIHTKSVIFSIPDFSTFCTSFDIPAMTQKEIPDAIQYTASQYITLPISEVTLDWRVAPNNPADKNSSLKVFLVAVPNQVVQEYQKIAKDSGLQLYALEAEALSITRALIKNNTKTVCLLDIGVQSSTMNVIDNGFLKRSYSFNFYSSQLARAVSSALGVEYGQAEEIKNSEGIISGRQGVSETLYLLIDPLLSKVRSICAEFSQTEKREVQEIYLTGGTANLPGLREYFEESLKMKVFVPNCFTDLLYSPILESSLRKMSPSYSVAVGAALSGIETL